MLIKAASILNDRGCPCNVLLIGDDSEREKLNKLVMEEGIADRVCFYGACYREEEIAPLIMLSEVCVSPGEVGLTCIHSLVYGTPVISHDNFDRQMPEYEAIRPGHNGDFFKCGDLDHLVCTIRKWLKTDRRRNEIANTCHEVIDRYYNPQRQLESINNAIHGLMQTQNG